MARDVPRVLPLLGVIPRSAAGQMLGTPSIRRYHALLSHPLRRVPVMGGDNATGADNQQERPVTAQWVVGFVDGEGCFSISIFRNRTCAHGWQVQPEFTVSQGARSVQVLYLLEQYFECGSVG